MAIYDVTYQEFYRYLVVLEVKAETVVLEFSTYDVAVSVLNHHKAGTEVILIDNLVPEDVPF